MNEIETLIQELLQASQSYYQDGDESDLTDEEFDAKLELLETLAQNPEHAHLFAPNTPAWGLLGNDVSLGSTLDNKNVDTITHAAPMLSLNKAKNETELQSYVTRARNAGATDFALQAKLDGFALSVTYDKGAIKILATRGTGTQGENVDYLLNDPNVTIVGLPRTITDTRLIEVRGELFFTDTQFNTVDDSRYTLTGERFKNSRNSVVGLMKKAKLGVDYPVEFTFSTYSVRANNKPTLLSTVTNLGFKTVDKITQEQNPNLILTGFNDNKELFQAVHDFGVARKTFTIPTDGVVIKPVNEDEMLEKMGNTSHHPVSQIAYKYPGETADTIVTGITVTVGKTGKLTPCASVQPVLVEGTLISNITMNNFNWVAEKDVRVGSHVRIQRANGVIPEIAIVLSNPSNSTPLELPETCPACNTELEIDTNTGYWPPRTITCNNINCTSRDMFALKTAVSKNFLDIDGLSEVTLTTLYETGRITDISDLYTLTLEELADSQLGSSQQGNPRRLGEARAQNILDHIQASKTLPLPRLIASLNIAGMGVNTAKILVKTWGTIDNIMSQGINEIANLENFGEIKAEKIVNGFQQRANLVTKLRAQGVDFEAHVDNTSNTVANKSLAGYSFAISGEVPAPFNNRNAWVEYIEDNGAVFHSTPKTETTFIIGDPTSTSSKTMKAIKLGITFMSSTEFTEKYVN